MDGAPVLDVRARPPRCATEADAELSAFSVASAGFPAVPWEWLEAPVHVAPTQAVDAPRQSTRAADLRVQPGRSRGRTWS